MTKHIPNKRFEKEVVKQILILSPHPYSPFEEEATFSRFFPLLKVSITNEWVCVLGKVSYEWTNRDVCSTEKFLRSPNDRFKGIFVRI